MGFSLRVIKDGREEVKKRVRESAMKHLEEAANELLRVANETIPYEEGVMAGSGEVSTDASQLRARVSYGGAAKAYVLKQHEDTTLRHDPGRRAKWLELAAKENAQRLGVSIGVGMRDDLG